MSLACVPPASESPEEDSADITANGKYAITVVGSGKCLDVYQASLIDGGKVQQWPCGVGKANQTWQFVPAGSGSYEIVSVNSGKVLDVDHALTTNGAAILQWTWHAADNQRWKLVSAGSGTYELQSVKSGKCLDVTGSSTANGALVQQWSCRGSSNQRFKLAVVSSTAPAPMPMPAPVDGGTAGAGGAGGGGAGGTGGASDGCTLKWSPSASRDGKNAFEGLEMPDLNGVHPGAVHFSTVADHDAFRIDQHADPGAMDYDQKVTDRLRCEVKGLRVGSTNLQFLEGQTWKLSWSLLVPSTLKASTHFHHIWQMKHVTTDGSSSASPILTLDLTRQSGAEKITLDVFGQSSMKAVNLIHDRWLTTEVTVKIGTSGSVHWVLRDGNTVLADETKTGVSTWPANAARLRPKWGIYRSLADPADIQTSYLLLSDFKGYSCP